MGQNIYDIFVNGLDLNFIPIFSQNYNKFRIELKFEEDFAGEDRCEF